MRIIVSLILVIASLSCNNSAEENNQETKIELKHDIVSQNLFSLNKSDSLIFFFSKRKSFDTSWKLILKLNEEKNIKGYYSQIVPKYHRDHYDYLDDSLKLLFEEVFTFNMTEGDWNNLIQKTNLNSYKSLDTTRYTCIHCPYYLLNYHGKIINSNNLNQPFLDSVAFILKSEVINELFFIKENKRAYK